MRSTINEPCDENSTCLLTGTRPIHSIARSDAHQRGGLDFPMPLPNVKSGRTEQCMARSKRSLARCNNPCAFGCKTCRFHGARRPETVLRGSEHPKYKHGRDTLEAKRNRVQAMTRIRALVDLAIYGGFLSTKVTGRRPNRRQRISVSNR
jgi:hypothetical protein